MISNDITLALQPIKKQKTEKRPLTEFEKLCIEQAQFTSKQKLFLDVLRYTGIRRGEALALTVDDVNLDNKTLSINKNLVFIDNNSKTKEPKTVTSNRIIPIPELLFDELHDYISSTNLYILFPNSKNSYMTRSAFRKFWQSIMTKVRNTGKVLKNENNLYVMDEIDFSPHILRHTFATDLYYAGVDIKCAQYLLGHSSIDVTLEIYTHLDKNKLNNSIAVFDDYMKKISPVSQKSVKH